MQGKPKASGSTPIMGVVRHNLRMRSLAVLVVLAACGGAPQRATSPTAIVTPARDLASAKPAAERGASPGSARPGDSNRAARDPRVVDLDIIRITAHARGPGGDADLTAVASADLFKQANQAAKEGRPREAIG